MAKATRPVLVLDAGGVLVTFDFTRACDLLYEKTGKRLALPLSPSLTEAFQRAEIHGPSWIETSRAVGGELGVELPVSKWEEIWCSIFTGQVPGMEEVLRELKRDFSLIALSNTCQVHWEFVCRSYPIMKLFDGFVVSYQVGAAKPDPRIYRVVEQRFTAGSPPFFFTDDIEDFVVAARQVGWDAEVFQGAQWLSETVKTRLASKK